MKRFKKALLALAIIMSFVPAVAGPAASVAAYNPLDKVCQSGGAGANSPTCGSQNTTRVVGKDGIIARVTRIIASVGAIVAVIMIIFYGFQIVTSYGDSGKVTAARNAVIGAVIGLIVIALAQAIVVFLVSNL